MTTAVARSADPTVLPVFLAAVAFGGSNAVAIKVGLVELAPVWSAILRFGLSALIFLAIAVVVRPPLPRGRELLGSVLYGLAGFAAAYAFAYTGLQNGGAAVGQVVIAVAPLLTLLLAVGIRIEPFHWQGLAGSLIAGAGIVVVFWDRLTAAVPLLSLLLFLGGALAIAVSNVLVKRFPPGHPVPANAIGMAIGGLVLVPLSLLFGETWRIPTQAASWASVLYLATVGSVALFLAYLYVLSRWSASATSFILLFDAALDGRGGSYRSGRADHSRLPGGWRPGPRRDGCRRVPRPAAARGAHLPAAGGGADPGGGSIRPGRHADMKKPRARFTRTSPPRDRCRRRGGSRPAPVSGQASGRTIGNPSRSATSARRSSSVTTGSVSG